VKDAAPPPTPTVSAIVANYNGGQRLLNTLDALQRQAFPLARIIVVDNGSTDDSSRRVRERFPQLELLELPDNRGVAAPRNAGLRHVDTDYVLLIDADVYVAEDCIARLVEALRAEQAAACCPRIRCISSS